MCKVLQGLWVMGPHSDDGKACIVWRHTDNRPDSSTWRPHYAGKSVTF